MRISIWKVQAHASLGLFLLLHSAGAWSFQTWLWLDSRSTTSNETSSTHCKDDADNCYNAGTLRNPNWTSDCDFSMPSYRMWKDNRVDDVYWLRRHLRAYKRLQNDGLLHTNELTFPTYMLQRYAPNVPPSNMLCDGLGMCMPPSCKDIGQKHDPETKRRAMLFFESVAGINHSFHILSEAIQDHFRHIHEDIARLTRQFTYADEQQDAAVKEEERKAKKKQRMELIINFIGIMIGLLTAGLGFLALSSTAVGGTAAFAPIGNFARLLTGTSEETLSNGKVLTKLSGLMGAINGAFSVSNTLVTQTNKNNDHQKDLHGFEKTLDKFHSTLTTIDMAQTNRTSHGMTALVLGDETISGQDIVDLYRESFFFGADVHLREKLDFQMEMKTYGAVINALWRLEGVYIVASWAQGGNCTGDTRGPSKNKVRLDERPDRAYWVQAITNFGEKKMKIHYPPGLDALNPRFHGISLDDVVRSSIWFTEVYGPVHGKWIGDMNHDRNEELDNDPPEEVPPEEKRDVFAFEPEPTIPAGWNKTLKDYGYIPGIFQLPICYSWYGEAISTINQTHNANAPCHCDPPVPILARHWANADNWTMAYTKKAVKEGEWHQFSNYGKMCLKRHDCHKSGYWKALLKLPEDVKPAKHMKHAWKGCHSTGHSDHTAGDSQLTNSTDDSPRANDPESPVSPKAIREPRTVREPLMKTSNTTMDLGFLGIVPNSANITESKERCLDTLNCSFTEVIRVVETKYGHSVDLSRVGTSEGQLYGCIRNDEQCIEESVFVACEDLSGDEESTDDGGWGWDEDAEDEDGFAFPEYDPDKERKTMKNTGNNRTECICAQEGISCSQNPVLVTKTVVESRKATRTRSKTERYSVGAATPAPLSAPTGM